MRYDVVYILSFVNGEDASCKLHETAVLEICDVVGSGRSGKMKSSFTRLMETDIDLSLILRFIVLSFHCVTS